MVLRNVAKTFSLEEQRQEINEIAVDLDAVNTTLTNWNAANWDTAYSWGDHAQAGYWVDVSSDRTNWNTAYGWGDHAQVGYWVDVPSDRTNWNTAYGWGDHAQVGYALSTALANSANWDTAYGWGDHALAGYLTSYTETDPVFGASAASGIAAGDITNWNTAYGWGDHSTEGYAVGTIPTPGGTYAGTGTTEDPIIQSVQLNAGSGNFGGDASLVWNTTTNRFGIGTSGPSTVLDVVGTNVTDTARFYSATAGNNNRVRINTLANEGGHPYIKFDSGGNNMVVGQYWQGTTNNQLVLGTGEDPTAVTGIAVGGNGNVGIGTFSSNPYSKFVVDSGGGASNLDGGAFVRTGTSWDTVGTTHLISYPDYAEGDNSTGMLLVHAKSPTTNKVGTIFLLWYKNIGGSVAINQLNAFAAGMTTFSTQSGGVGNNDIQVNTDSDVAICWQVFGAR